jgi:hypothetical protein
MTRMTSVFELRLKTRYPHWVRHYAGPTVGPALCGYIVGPQPELHDGRPQDGFMLLNCRICLRALGLEDAVPDHEVI